jgi:ketosteroid isomerase-like protein
MTIGSNLLERHFATLVADNGQWQSLIDDDLLWELVYAPSLGHPARLSGREEVMRQVTWFLSAVENFRFLDLRIHPMADPEAAAAEIRADALIKATGRPYRQEYVVFLRCKSGKITHLREYFDPVRAAKALDAPISDASD